MGLRDKWRSWRRRTRAVVILLLVLLGVPLLLLLSLTLPPVRSGLLAWGARQAADSLPGQLTWSRLAWPAVDRLELGGVLWTDEGDTVASLSAGSITWGYGQLRQRQLDLHEIELSGLRLDLPLLQALLPAPATDRPATGSTSPAFPAPGAIPELPGIGLRRLELAGAAVRLDSLTTLHLDSLAAHAELRRGREPVAGLRWSSVRDDPQRFVSPRGRLRLEPETRRVEGEIELSAPGTGDFALQIAPAGGDSTRLTLQGELAAGSSLDLDGALFLPDLQTAGLRLRGIVPGLRLDDLRLTVQAPRQFRGAWRAELRAVALDLGVQLAVEATPGDSLQALLSPLIVRAQPASLDSWPNLEPATRLVLDPSGDGGLHLERWPVRGDLGDLVLYARLDAERRGRIGLEGEWIEFPRALPFLVELPVERTRPLRSDWPTDPQPRLEVTLEASPGPDSWVPQAVEVAGSLRVPGPARLLSLLAEPGTDPATALPIDLKDWTGLEARWSGAADWSGPAPRARLDLDLGRTRWLQRGRLVADYDGRTVRIDSLVLALEGMRLTAAGRAGTACLDLAGSLRLDDSRLLERSAALAGRVDSLAAELDWKVSGPPRAPEATVDLQAALRAAGFASDDLAVNARYRPDGLRYAVRVDERGSASGGVDLSGRSAGRFLATIDSLVLAIEGQDLRSRQPVRLRYSAPDTSWSIEGVDLAGSLGTVEIAAAARPDSLAARIRLELGATRRDVAARLPDAPGLLLEDGRVQLAAEVDARLQGGTPRLDGRAELRLTGEDAVADLALTARAAIDSAAPGRLAVTADLATADSTLARTQVRLPLELSLQPPALRLALEDSTYLDLHSVISDLTILARLLPAGLRLAGSTRLNLSAAGRDTVFGLDGRFAGRDLRVDLADGSWAELEGGLRVAGTSEKPQIDGDLKIEAGLIQLPEVTPSLLPTSGQALLWPGSAAGADTARPARAQPVPRAPAARDVALEFLIECPGNLWLRGQGLEVELEGELNASWQNGRPALVGRLGAARGTFRILGRVFRIERGEATFLGDLATDPYLDLVLTAEVGGVSYRIELTGPALEPELVLGSDPEMSQGDIMSSLLFGKPLDELDEGQEELLRQRAGQVLLAYGAVRLQDQLSRRLGVDLVTIHQGTSDDQVSSLVLGKYLSPRVLLSYEQFLDADSTFRVKLEYALSRSFDIETTVGQGDASGVDLLWSRDY